MDKRLTPTEKFILAGLPLVMSRPSLPEDFIYLLTNEECCEYLQVSQPSFTRALRKFKKLGLIKFSFTGRIRILEGGTLLPM